jgi:multicomponent Na+:H+ antiporter subunit E
MTEAQAVAGSEPRTETKKSMGKRVLQQIPLLVGLILLWMLLWGEISWLSAFSGLLVAVGVTRIFYLPPVELSGRFNILWFAVFVLRFALDLVVSSVTVAAQAFRPGKLPLNAIIEVPLRTRSDFVLSVTATVISLVPGTLVLEIDRERSLLFLHLLAAGDEEGVEKGRRSALAIEASVIRALGSRDDLERVRA